ncbi:MAG: ABC transporter ATP-binding protein [Rhodospirillales bacterium]
MSVLRLDGLSKSYGATEALRDVSFECREGEFFTLFGPSGAGKTTILELIAGTKRDYSGSIQIKGRAAEGLAIQERNVSMAFENYALYPHLSVGENIAFPLRSPRAAKIGEAEIAKKVQWTADELGIGHLLDRNPVQLSGGQKQRVSLARALVRPADVYLLDEPIAHLDAKLRSIARANLKAMARNLGATIVYVTHDFREALGLSDRVLVLNEGRVLQIAEPRALYHHPKTDFVGHLLGDPAMNLVDGELREGPVFVSEGVTFNLAGKLAAEAKARLDEGKRDARLGIRPSGVAVSLEDPGGATPLPLYTLEHTPDHALIYVQIGDGFFGGLAPLRTRLPVGAQVWLQLQADAGHLFDASFPLTVSSRHRETAT